MGNHITILILLHDDISNDFTPTIPITVSINNKATYS